MKTDEVLQKEVQDAIKWDPLLNAAEIGVTAKDGVVTLTGTVDTFIKKSEVENAVKKVIDVNAIVEEIVVKSGNPVKKSDVEIATEILNSLNLSSEITKDKIQLKVEAGWVTLGGELKWVYQKEDATSIATSFADVKGVINNITIKSERVAKVEKETIENALISNWSLEDEHILVSVSENKVKLNGTVHSWFQKEAASRIAWNALGIINVDNRLTVDYLKNS